MNADERNPAGGNACGGWRRSLWKGPALFTALFMLFPLFGSLYIEGWRWHPFGFVVVAALIFSVCFAYKLVTRNHGSLAYRAATGIAFFLTLALAWSSLVQWADVNRYAAIHFVVPVVEVIGVAFARLRPSGMARALFATAIAQIVAMAVVSSSLLVQNPLITSWSGPQLRGVFGSTVVAILFAGAALLFQKAAREESASEAI
jgi:hypothetical protein